MIERDKQSARSLEQPAPVEPENVQAAAGRRRFLKGLSIGLPAVVTLYQGAVLAATSSTRCLQNRSNDNPLAGQNHLRTSSCPASDYAASGPVSVRVYTKSDPTKPGPPARSFYYDNLGSYGQLPVWREVEGGSDLIDGNLYSGPTGLLELDGHMTSLGYSPVDPNQTSYAVTYVDDNGTITSRGPLGAVPRALPVTCSCWTSAMV